MHATQCGGKENCLGEAGRCMTHELWTALNQHMKEFLEAVTLQQLVDEQFAKGFRIEDKPPVRRAISTTPVVKPIRVNAPNSVFALGSQAFANARNPPPPLPPAPADSPASTRFRNHLCRASQPWT